MDQQISSFENLDRMYVRIWAAFCVVLIAFTWKLWLPGFTQFPRVPIFLSLDSSSLIGIHYLATTVLNAALLALVIGRSHYRWFAGIAGAAFAILFFCNQHCLQPWAWQAFIIATLLACMPMEEAKRWIRRVLISIYLYSAIGKFDFQFANTLGIEFLDVMLSSIDQSETMSASLKARLALLFPLGELLVGVGLLFRRTQWIAAWSAIGLHLILIVILSPLGLGHRWPVVLWNAMSILFVAWLFLPRLREVETSRISPPIWQRFGVWFAIVILAGPVLRPVQLWDHWLAWGLYSPSNSRVEVFIADTARARLSDSLDRYFEASDDQFGTSQFAMDRWSLHDVGAPIYPQARFQRAAAFKWLSQEKLLETARVVQFSHSHPLTGERTMKVVILPTF